MDFERQKEAAGSWATFVWIGSGLYLYLSTEGASILSWSALGFFVVGMFAAAIVFGIASYGLQRGLAKVLAMMIGPPSRKVAGVIRGIALALLIAETVLIFFAASWVFYRIEPSQASTPAEYRADRADFIASMNAFIEANQINQQIMAGRDVAKADPQQEAKMEALIEKGLEHGRKVRPEFLAYLHPDLPDQYRARLLKGHEMLLQGWRTGNVMTQASAIELIQRFYDEFWHSHVEEIITTVEGM